MAENIGKITIIVCTINNKKSFLNQWKTILDSPLLHKIILVMQGSSRSRQNSHPKVMKLFLRKKGSTRAMNHGLKYVSKESSIIAFTDDDCYIDKNWLKAINGAFIDNHSIDLVFGQTFPYRPGKHKGKFCPSTFSKSPNKPTVVSTIGKHWVDVGFSNNFATRKKVFDRIGVFKEWLGPGSYGIGGDDAEIILRCLITGYKIGYNHKMSVYHDKWLNNEETRKLLWGYYSGGIAAYYFYALQGVKETMSAVIHHFKTGLKNITSDLGIIRDRPLELLHRTRTMGSELYFMIRGFLLAFVYAKIKPIPFKEDVVRRYYFSK